jgi:5-methyltetrahydropteroyltriglutamate--homocysteine methyltransferase
MFFYVHNDGAQRAGGGTVDDLKRLRVDNVGSMLRPDRLREAFVQRAEGELGDDELTRLQDEAIRELVAHQERIGYPIVVDGEFRRTGYLASFNEIEGAEDWLARWTPRRLHREQPVTAGAVRGFDPVHSDDLRNPATARLRLRRNVPLEELRFLQSVSSTPAKVTLIGPDRVSTLHNPEHPDDVYEDAEAFLADVVAVEREMVGQLVEAGCRYVHIDEPGFTAYADEASLDVLRSRGDDPMVNMQRSVDANNALIDGWGDDVTFGVHLCRGNRESQWHREGTYDAIAEGVLGQLRYDRLLLEYDTDRAGGFEPLRFVRDDAVVVLGLLTTKTGALEDADDVKRRIEEASAYVPVERLALSPQCGFASGISGNLLSEDEQWAKLELVLQVAQDVWGA